MKWQEVNDAPSHNVFGEFNFEVQESGEGELGACESTDLGRKLSSDETIQTPNS